jgi:competence protein ComEA
VVGRREQEDPVLTEFVKERLAQLLAENVPRRAQPGGAGARRTQPERLRDQRAHPERPRDVFTAARARLERHEPPDLLPSDDDEADDEQGQSPSSFRSDLAGRRVMVPEQRPMARTRLAAHEPLAAADEIDELDDWVDPPPRRSFGRAHLGVIVGLLLMAVVCAGWLVLRARPVAIASPPLVRTSAAAATGGASPGSRPSSSSTPAAPIMVHVLGAVRKPGVVTLPEHSRVRDAIQAAGGLARGAAPGELNLAQVLADGQQVIIGTVKKPSGEVRDDSGSAQSGGTDPASGAAGQINLNAATQSQLEELPGVGPVTAAKILAWREEHGRFSRVEELQEVDGIGPKTFAQIAPHARV